MRHLHMPNDAIQRDLKSVQEVVSASATSKKALLWLEMRHLEREKLLCESVENLVQVEIFSSVRSVVVTGASLSLLVLIYSKLVQLASWVEHAGTVTIPLPPPISRDAVLNLGAYVPSSTAISALAKLPAIDWQVAWKWVLVIVVMIAAEKAITGYQTWRRSQTLRRIADEIQEELQTLKGWLGEER